jgi:hypothetical protein
MDMNDIETGQHAASEQEWFMNDMYRESSLGRPLRKYLVVTGNQVTFVAQSSEPLHEIQRLPFSTPPAMFEVDMSNPH